MGKKKKILIVDDEQIVWTILREALDENKWYILVALHGYEGIHQARVMKPDVIIMDYRMPDINGWKATSKIKEYLPNVVVIGHTAYANDQMVKDGLEAGCSEILSKPVDLDQWERTLNKYT